jgi:hypothetical protein
MKDNKFITLNGDDEIQTIKFDTSSDMKATVKLPNGDLLEFSDKDTIPPLEVNSELQISIIFEIVQ